MQQTVEIDGRSSLPQRTGHRRRSRRAGIAVAALLLPVVAPASPALAAKDETTLVSRADGAAGAKGDGFSQAPSISADGRLVAFDSASANLDLDDTDTSSDVFVRDLRAAATTLLSRADGAGGAKGNGDSDFPSISADGRFVAFESDSTNLGPADTDTATDVYVRDLSTGETTLVSRADGAGGVKGNGGSDDPSISADGQFVAFESNAANLDPADTDATRDIFFRDLADGETQVVSRAEGAAGTKGDGDSFAPSISADGRFVAFRSNAANLDPDDTDAIGDIFVRDVLGPVDDGGGLDPSPDPDPSPGSGPSPDPDPNPDPDPIEPDDTTVAIEIAGGKVKLNRRGRAKVELACPADETSPPCAGKLTLRTRKKVSFGGDGNGGKPRGTGKRRVKLAEARFSIGAGQSEKVKLRLSRKKLGLVQTKRKARRVTATAKAADAAGNEVEVSEKLKLKPKRPRRAEQ